MCKDVFHFYDGFQVLEREDAPFDRKERLKAMEKALLSWYKEHARSLPWRDDPKPYRVWISEIMLQQTRVEAVKPYFARFMKAFPGVKELAQAEDDLLFKMWEGLGYYNRARNLKAAAQKIVTEYGGELPASYEALLTLPGIGSYTAGAIASIAYGIAVPAVDGNVLRVLTRLLGDRSDITKASVKKRLETELKEVMPQTQTGSYNQALIEVGALVCIPNGEPKCTECPLQSLCLTAKNDWWREIPFKPAKKSRKLENRTVFLLEYEDRIAVRKRPDEGLLASLYEFPNVEGKIEKGNIASCLGISEEMISSVECLPAAKHIFSHIEWHMTGYRVRLLQEPGKLAGQMVKREEIRKNFAIASAFSAYTKLLG